MYSTELDPLLTAVLDGLPGLSDYAQRWNETPQPTTGDLLRLLDRAAFEESWTPDSAIDIELVGPAITELRGQLTAPALPAAA